MTIPPGAKVQKWLETELVPLPQSSCLQNTPLPFTFMLPCFSWHACFHPSLTLGPAGVVSAPRYFPFDSLPQRQGKRTTCGTEWPASRACALSGSACTRAPRACSALLAPLSFASWDSTPTPPPHCHLSTCSCGRLNTDKWGTLGRGLGCACLHMA